MACLEAGGPLTGRRPCGSPARGRSTACGRASSTVPSRVSSIPTQPCGPRSSSSSAGATSGSPQAKSGVELRADLVPVKRQPRRGHVRTGRFPADEGQDAGAQDKRSRGNQGSGPEPERGPVLSVPIPKPEPEPGLGPWPRPEPAVGKVQTKTVQLVGTVPPEVWKRSGTKVLPKLWSGTDLKIDVDFSVMVNRDLAGNLVAELRQILDDLEMADRVQIQDEE